MKALLCVALAALYSAAYSKHSPPKVQVYSSNPAEFGKENVLICHVSNFHPPDISIQLLRDGVELPGANQTDLAFNNNWHFHLTKSVRFTPEEGQKLVCRVTHGGKEQDMAWESNM